MKIYCFVGFSLKNRDTSRNPLMLLQIHVGTSNKDLIVRATSMSVEAMVQAMIDDLTATLVDAAKHDKGNSAAGTRVRKAMQACKSAAQDVRIQVQNDKNN